MRQRAMDRPSMVYTLGWWMIRTISKNGTDKQPAIALLAAPDRLFETYNAAIGTADPSLRIAL